MDTRFRGFHRTQKVFAIKITKENVLKLAGENKKYLEYSESNPDEITIKISGSFLQDMVMDITEEGPILGIDRDTGRVLVWDTEDRFRDDGFRPDFLREV